MKGRILLKKGDITKLDVDAIVNAANRKLMGGGGVDGAIHAAGGPQILEACRSHVDAYGECPTGDAIVTTGGLLPVKYVIHTVGPVWQGGRFGERTMLENCYVKSLQMAQSNGVKTLAFPNISTGIYGYPKEEAAETAIDAVLKFMEGPHDLEKVIFMCFSDDNYDLYEKILKEKKIID